MQAFAILMIPFVGTSLGAAMVFLMRGKMNLKLEKFLLGFASGVMIAASVWSLLIPAIELSEEQNMPGWFPAAAGFLLGIAFLLLLDSLIPHLHKGSDTPEGVRSKLPRAAMLVFAVTLHNLPEGMAVGVTLAGALLRNTGITMAGSLGTAASPPPVRWHCLSASPFRTSRREPSSPCPFGARACPEKEHLPQECSPAS